MSALWEIAAHSAYDMLSKKVQVGNDQEKAQSEKDSHSKNRVGKKTKLCNCEADQRLCFRYTDNTLLLLVKSKF